MPTRRKKRRPHPRSGHGPGSNYPFDFRLRLVKMRVEEGISIADISKETGVSRTALCKWLGRYRASGEAGLHPGGGKPREGRQQFPQCRRIIRVRVGRQPTDTVRRRLQQKPTLAQAILQRKNLGTSL